MINILACDDDLDFHEILKIKLPATEFKLTLSSTEKEFWEKFDTQKFDLFLMDLSIDDSPVKGLELINKIRSEKNNETPIIVLSGSNSEKILSNALELGANDYNSKPLDGRLLISKIKAAVSGGQAFSEIIKFGKFPGKQPDVTMTTRLRLKGISELGLLVEGNAFIAKGTKFKLASARIKEIFGVDVIDLYSNGFSAETNGVYLSTFEINPENKDLIAKAKFWIKSNQK